MKFSFSRKHHLQLEHGRRSRRAANKKGEANWLLLGRSRPRQAQDACSSWTRAFAPCPYAAGAEARPRVQAHGTLRLRRCHVEPYSSSFPRFHSDTPFSKAFPSQSYTVRTDARALTTANVLTPFWAQRAPEPDCFYLSSICRPSGTVCIGVGSAVGIAGSLTHSADTKPVRYSLLPAPSHPSHAIRHTSENAMATAVGAALPLSHSAARGTRLQQRKCSSSGAAAAASLRAARPARVSGVPRAEVTGLESELNRISLGWLLQAIPRELLCCSGMAYRTLRQLTARPLSRARSGGGCVQQAGVSRGRPVRAAEQVLPATGRQLCVQMSTRHAAR